jgi:hypothetical protein
VGYVACLAVKRNVYKILTGKPEGKKALRRPTCRGKILKWMQGCGVSWKIKGKYDVYFTVLFQRSA